ncbi:MAG: sugar ABC transporter permease [Oscillospiraceae bacterium]|jgi:multiple sugar transport system permease protein|nr:sugar ABC transporter permease [Oscillospiraceae bacterium]
MIKRLSPRHRESLIGLLYASLPLIGFSAFFTVPFGISIVRTFYSGAGGQRFVGFENYISIFQSEAFQLAFVNTMRFIGVGVPLILVFSFIISVALQGKIRGKNTFRSLLVLPLIVPVASVILVFSILFERSGIVNNLLISLGLLPIDFLNSDHAFTVLIILYLWKNSGYNIILLMAGLSQIPGDYYDAAKVDGAGKLRITLFITLPMMVPALFFTTVISIINSFKSFREAFALGGSYPHQSIYMLQHFMNNNFYNLNYARLSVASLITFIIIIALVSVMYILRQKAGDHQL